MDTVSDVLGKMDAVGSQVFTAIFKKSLSDLVQGIRANQGNESKYINSALQEIKEELKSIERDEKAVAIQKLTYLQMMGYNMDWASFRIIEVISNSKFSHKRIGYLAASQTFSESTDVALLITNLIRKDCLSPNMYDGGVALDCLSNICTTELARDLVPDIVNMLNSARPYIRKKSVLVMYKVFLRFPDALRPSFPRLKEKLDDADQSVVSAAVNVICELARKNAKNYLALAPTLFKLMNTSNNNWMLIKIVKLFAMLLPVEERLAKRLADPLCNIINSTSSMSLMYEAIYTCIVGLSSSRNIMQLCVSKLRSFIEHPDQNLKYLGLLALSKIMEVFPKSAAEHRDIILSCLEDEDQTIRLRAVELLTGMVDKKNISYIVDKLRQYLESAEGTYRDELLEKIIYICSQEKYKHITDFEWYLGVLMDLTQVKGVSNGHVISEQIFDVCVRVKVVRPAAVRYMLILLQDDSLITEDPKAGGMCESLYAAAWVVGEYADILTEQIKAIDILTRSDVTLLPPHIQSLFIMNAYKILCAIAVGGASSSSSGLESEEGRGSDTSVGNVVDSEKLNRGVELFLNRLTDVFCTSPHVEVQERACFVKELLLLVKEHGIEAASQFSFVMDEAMNPVSKEAQARVPVPDGLDLDSWINDPIPPEPEPYQNNYGFGSDPWAHEDESAPAGGYKGMASYGGFGSDSSSSSSNYGNEFNQPTSSSGNGPRYAEVSQEEIERMRQQQRAERQGNIFYLGGEDEVGYDDSAPVRRFEEQFPDDARMIKSQGGIDNPDQQQPRPAGRPSFANMNRPRGPMGRGPRMNQPVSIITDEENPDGWDAVKEEEKKKASKKKQAVDANDPLANIDLTAKNDDFSILQHKQHHTVKETAKPQPQGGRTGSAPGRVGRAPGGRAGRVPVGGRAPGGAGRVPGRGAGRGPAPGAPTNQTSTSAPAPASQPTGANAGRGPAPGRGRGPASGRGPAPGRGPAGGRGPAVRGRGPAPGRGPAGGRGRGGRVAPPSQPKDAAAPPQPIVSAPRPPRLYPLTSDDNVELSYLLTVNNNEIRVNFNFKNKSTNNSSLKGFQLKFDTTTTTTTTTEGEKSPSSSSLQPILKEGEDTHKFNVTLENADEVDNDDDAVVFTYTEVKAYELKSTLTYTSIESGSTEEKSHSVNVVIVVPVTAFVKPENLDKSEFMNLLRTVASETKTVSINQADLAKAVTDLTGNFNVEVVEKDDEKASMYGKSLNGSHVAFLVKKGKSENSLVVAVKSNDAGLAASLVDELTKYNF
eukprot:TRINITY_DN2586_c1_g1_i1.p1 TRINITY_DN2586_c1_g1~~TRINITY_DN2586_c1_g1_i1.p1  ORF type:complete len:1273 (-),score=465.08 TRINITY_DN2586_c1_g1_i1:117-3935(-)